LDFGFIFNPDVYRTLNSFGWWGVVFFIIGIFLLEETKLGWYHPLMMQGLILAGMGYTLREMNKIKEMLE